MHRPLETTVWMRITQFVKGVFLYNTIYWKRASDDLNIRHMSREERATLRPKRNLDIIRPRENPRPVNVPTLSLPPEVREPRPAAPAVPIAPVAPEPVHAAEPAPPAGREDGMEIHRRKKRRRSRHSKVLPKQYYDPAHEPSGGILGWLFKK